MHKQIAASIALWIDVFIYEDHSINMAQSTGAVEYADCIAAEV